MPSAGLLKQVAVTLREAYAKGAVPPVGKALGAADDRVAYEVQEINTRHWLAQGRMLVGRKIGLTSPAVQAQLGVDQPDYGMLFADMEVPHEGVVPAGRLIQPKVEAELAMGLRTSLDDAALTLEDLVASIDWLAPAIEIVDSRIRDWQISLTDTIADNASSALFALGPHRLRPSQFDAVGCQMIMKRDSEPVSQGTGRDCLGNPYAAALWLAKKMVEIGRPLRAGDVILSGALGPMSSVVAGKTYRATIGELGSVVVTFACA